MDLFELIYESSPIGTISVTRWDILNNSWHIIPPFSVPAYEIVRMKVFPHVKLDMMKFVNDKRENNFIYQRWNKGFFF